MSNRTLFCGTRTSIRLKRVSKNSDVRFWPLSGLYLVGRSTANDARKKSGDTQRRSTARIKLLSSFSSRPFLRDAPQLPNELLVNIGITVVCE